MSVPSKLLLSVEGIRSLYEYAVGWILNMPLQYICPKGDGHPVMVIPGLGTADGSTHYIRNFIEGLGYEPHSWGMGRNLGPRRGFDNMLEQLVKNLTVIYEGAGNTPVSLIGWSLGGIYAREIAKRAPHMVRQVITLGTPFKGDISSGTNATALYELLSRDKSHKDPIIIKQLSTVPPVPFTSIYSKSDGVVDWECSIESEGEYIENVEVPAASHLGLGHNPVSMYIVATRLSQTKATWKPLWS